MADGFRVRLATNPKYFPADSQKGHDQFATARLVEANWSKNDAGEWVEGDPTFYDGVFNGQQADLIREYQSGDALLVIGASRIVEREHEGKTYKNPTLYANHFSPDLTDRAVTVVMDRSQRANRTREAAPAADQEADQVATSQVQATPAAAADRHPDDNVNAVARATVEAEMLNRVHALVKQGHLSAEDAAKVTDVYESARNAHPDELRASVDSAVKSVPLSDTARTWLMSVPNHLSSAASPMTWAEATEVTQPAPSPSAEVPPPAVAQTAAM
ncbi:MAG: hypothetical protein GX862_05975 [Leucobacter sp.]|jgi:chorismate mutase|nr:hypothetical protein [Leucobacter sp.]